MMVKSSLAGARVFARVRVVKIRWLALVLAVILIPGLAGCAGGPAATVVSPVTEPTTAAPTNTLPPADTPTPEPTATLEPTTPPTLTATPLPPTSTPLPPLAVQTDGFKAWCAPEAYTGLRPDGPDAPGDARLLTQADSLYRVPIPAGYCVIAYQFNQPVPAGLELRVLDGTNPFIQQPLEPASGQPDLAWTTLTHAFVLNPPLWEVTYTLVVMDPGGSELWSNPVTFAKPTPEECPYGGLPDPVTLYCAVTDPWEIEPKPGVEYPYDRSKLTPEVDE